MPEPIPWPFLRPTGVAAKVPPTAPKDPKDSKEPPIELLRGPQPSVPSLGDRWYPLYMQLYGLVCCVFRLTSDDQGRPSTSRSRLLPGKSRKGTKPSQDATGTTGECPAGDVIGVPWRRRQRWGPKTPVSLSGRCHVSESPLGLSQCSHRAASARSCHRSQPW